MPLTVVTLSKAPASLKGDLSKWMQEIATGVYVGNFNTKVREELWARIVESIRNGEATMSYAFRNEIGYQFITHNTDSQVTDYDGIPLVMFSHLNAEGDTPERTGFSDAAKRRAARRFSSKGSELKDSDHQETIHQPAPGKPYIVIDIETDGLDKDKNKMIEIGAVKIENGEIRHFSSLLEYDRDLPEEIRLLTGITNEVLNQQGIAEKDALLQLMDFIGEIDLVGYNISFDIGFISKALERQQMKPIINNVFDLLKFVKRENMFLDDYKLKTVLKAYEISDKVPHRALEDAKLIFELSCKLTKFQLIMKEQPHQY